MPNDVKVVITYSLIPKTAFHLFLSFVFFKMIVGLLAPSIGCKTWFFAPVTYLPNVKCKCQHSDDTVATKWSLSGTASQNLDLINHNILVTVLTSNLNCAYRPKQ